MARAHDELPASGEGRPAAKDRPVPVAEWVGAAVGALAALFLIGSLAYQALVHEETPPDVSVHALPGPAPEGGERPLAFKVVNAGGRTAAEVAVVATIAGAGDAPREVTIVFDYVPRGSEREGTVLLPAGADATLRIGGWREP
jgi:uncharacterized protein (TIGR02588 family)